MQVADGVLREVILLLAGIFCAAWLTYQFALIRKGSAGLQFALANFLTGLGVWMVSHRTGEPSFVYYQFADWLVIGGLVSFWSAVNHAVDFQRRQWWLLALPLAIEIAATAILPPDPRSYLVRALVFNAMCSTVALATLGEILLGHAYHRFTKVITAAIGWPFLAAGIAFAVRGMQVLAKAVEQSEPLRDSAGGFTAFLWIFFAILLFINISVVNMVVGKLLNEVQKMADHDPLTGVFSRRYLDDVLRLEHGRFLRYGHTLSFITIDLDNFKKINDTLGHEAGDSALVHACQTFANGLRQCDIFGRYGGEEFVLLCPDTDITSALDVAERLRLALQDTPFHCNGTQVALSASFGVASWQPEDQIQTLLKRADLALYQAKQLGRNRVCREQPLQPESAAA
jgi:diguanylate cyclase (GGDEF)-like protein